jgi:hypothetical protein
MAARLYFPRMAGAYPTSTNTNFSARSRLMVPSFNCERTQDAILTTGEQRNGGRQATQAFRGGLSQHLKRGLPLKPELVCFQGSILGRVLVSPVYLLTTRY